MLERTKKFVQDHKAVIVKTAVVVGTLAVGVAIGVVIARYGDKRYIKKLIAQWEEGLWEYNEDIANGVYKSAPYIELEHFIVQVLDGGIVPC